MATALVQGRQGAGSVRAAATPGTLFAGLLFFAVAFPKGGIKLYGVPITFGYAMTIVMLLIAVLPMRRIAIPLDRFIMGAACLLLAVWSALNVRVNGLADPGYTIAYFVAVVYMPIFGLTAFGSTMLDTRIGKVERALIWALRFVVCYGLFLFVFKLVTGRWIEIPYLTINADDLGTLDDKFINRGGIYKLISTYNNGNILGVSLCIIAPLYLRLEPRRWLRAAFYVTLILTLSRTVWIGFILILGMRTFSDRVQIRTLIVGLTSLLGAAIGLYSALTILGRDLSFIFDKNLGGRVQQLTNIADAGVISQNVVQPLTEIVYASVLSNYGYVGLLLFVIHLVLPPMLLKADGVPLLSVSRASACMQGLVLYLVIAASDAAFSFIPVLMIYWIVVGLAFWYRTNERATGVLAHARPR